MIEQVIEIASMVLMLTGAVFYFMGALGIARFPDLYTRLQASTLCEVMGASGIILGTILLNGISAASAKALLILIFILLTAPVSLHAISRGGYLSGVKMCSQSVADDYKSYRRPRAKRQKSARGIKA